MRGLQGKVYLVCGAASGIGAASATRLHREGARVLLADINEDGVSTLASTLDPSGESARAFTYDQSDESSITLLLQDVLEAFGQLDGLFANAANMQVLLEDGDLLQNDAGTWERTLQVNLLGTAALFRAALPHLQARGGVLLATSSDAASVGEPTRVAYATSKAAINALCRHVANRWGKEGIRCNTISPGFILTDNLKTTVDPAMFDPVLKSTPSPRHGSSEDVAAAVAFLFSDDAEWVNGQVWHVNGGIDQAN